MLLIALAAFVFAQESPVPVIARDTYGVPHIQADDWDSALYRSGYAVAQDRLWQMELSRRLARGQMSEVLGPQFVSSDREVLATGYTDDEIDKQFQSLSPQTRQAVDSYIQGVNAYITEAKRSRTLPPGYAQAGFEPRPWMREDTLSITIRMLQLFGRGGAGELRNLAVLTYLRQQPNAKSKALDIFDDLLWQNDPNAITTLPQAEDPQASNPPLKVRFTRKATEEQLAQLPALGLIDLIPALHLAEGETSKRVAENLGLPYRTGSYCVVVSPERSATGVPLLMSGPQMGFSNPSIIHEISISAPGLKVAGIDIPGVPGVIVGMTPNVAWGLTTGVADTEDIFDFVGAGEDSYRYAGQVHKLEIINRTLKVKGAPDQTVEQDRTSFGPVLLHSHGHFFARKSAFWGVELKSLDAFYGLYSAHTADAVENSIEKATMNFNFFYALPDGDCGWRYLGLMPIRPVGIDPRFPLPVEPKNDWQGFLSVDQMPHIRNPKVGLLANWNNKPAVWWPNYDTPDWGRIFHNEVLLDQVHKPTLDTQDLEQAAWSIARIDETASYFMPYAKGIRGADGDPTSRMAATFLRAFDGRLMDGSISAKVYRYWLAGLREEIFEGTTGNFVSPDLFALAAQPSIMLKALQGGTKIAYLGARTASQVAQAAFDDALKRLVNDLGADPTKWGYTPGGIAVSGETPIPYSNRGSYIQIISLFSPPFGRNVVPPGEAEAGQHAKDQAPLARAWLFKPFGF